MVPREVFRPKKKEETVGLRKLHSEQLHDVHCAPNSQADSVKDDGMCGGM